MTQIHYSPSASSYVALPTTIFFRLIQSLLLPIRFSARSEQNKTSSFLRPWNIHHVGHVPYNECR